MIDEEPDDDQRPMIEISLQGAREASNGDSIGDSDQRRKI